MADPRINVILGAKDEASRTVKGLRGQFEKFRKDAVTGFGLGAGIGVFNLATKALGKVVDVFGDAVRMAGEEEAEIAQLTRAIAENDDAWDGNIDSIEELINTRQRLAFSDGEQREALRLLVSSTKDVTEAQDLLATSMDFARLRGISLRTAADLLGRAFQGQFGTLSRYGVILGKGATATEALGEITKLAKGQAEAFADTTQGKGVRAQIAMDDAMQDLGRTIQPIVDNVLTLAAEGIPNLITAFGNLRRLIDPASAALEDLGSALTAEALSRGIPAAALVEFNKITRELDKTSVALTRSFDALGLTEEEQANALSVIGVVAEQSDSALADVNATAAALFNNWVNTGIPATDQVAERNKALGVILHALFDNFDLLGDEVDRNIVGVTGLTSIEEQATRVAEAFGLSVEEGGLAQRLLNEALLAAGPAAGVAEDGMEELNEDIVTTSTVSLAAKENHQKFMQSMREQIRRTRRVEKGRTGKNKQELTDVTALRERLERQQTTAALQGRDKRVGALQVQIDKLDVEIARLRAVKALADEIRDQARKPIIFKVDLARPGTGFTGLTGAPGRAHGGPVSAGKTFLVGERGPELLHMGGRSGHVASNRASFGGGGGNVFLDGELVGRIIDERLGQDFALTAAAASTRRSDR